MADRHETGAQILSVTLELLGVREIFTIAGDHVLPALDAMADGPFRLIDTRHEQAAGHMADAWARVNDRPGVVLATSPGFANVLPALANAAHAESPMLSIAGSAPLSQLGRGAMQEIDQVALARPVTKLSAMVTEPARIPDMVAAALRTAYSGRRGPVHLTIPVDVQQAEVGTAQKAYMGLDVPTLQTADDIIAHDAVNMIDAAERPVLIAGTTAAYSHWGEAVTEFAEAARVPVMTDGDARGLIADSHPWCAGFYDMGLNLAARLVPEADLVILAGKRQDVTIGYALPPAIGPDANVIQIDPEEAEIGRNRIVNMGLCGNVSAVLGQLTQLLNDRKGRVPPDRSAWVARLARERRKMDSQLAALDTDETPLHAMSVFAELRSQLGRYDCVVFDGGDFAHFGRAYLPAEARLSHLYFSTFGMLGASMGTALALKLAWPEERVVLVTGDGAFGFNAMELDTAVRQDIPITVIVGNDSAWGIDRQIQLGAYGRAVATDLLATRYDIVAEGLGAAGFHVTTRDQLGPALSEALSCGRPAVVNVEISRTVSPRGQLAVDRWRAGGN